MGSEKSQGLPWGLEPAHEFFAFAGRSVRSLHAVVETLVRPVIRIRREIADRFDIAAQLICDDHAWGAETGHKALQETPCRLGVAPRLDECKILRHLTKNPTTLDGDSCALDGKSCALDGFGSGVRP